MKRKKGYFSISAVAKMFSIHQQTIRLYEKQGLINPKRSDGNTRLFSEEDVDRLEEIVYLTHKLGINLAGVEMIFKLKKQIKNLQKDIKLAFDNANKKLDDDVHNYKQAIAQNAQELLRIKQQNNPSPMLKQESKKIIETDTDTNANPYWKIEYEEEP